VASQLVERAVDAEHSPALANVRRKPMMMMVVVVAVIVMVMAPGCGGLRRFGGGARPLDRTRVLCGRVAESALDDSGRHRRLGRTLAAVDSLPVTVLEAAAASRTQRTLDDVVSDDVSR